MFLSYEALVVCYSPQSATFRMETKQYLELYNVYVKAVSCAVPCYVKIKTNNLIEISVITTCFSLNHCFSRS